MKYFLCLSMLLFWGCGKNSIIVNLKNKSTTESSAMKYFLTTQEDLVDHYDVLDVVDLRLIISDLETLPIENESFEKVYRSLGNYSKVYNFNRAVLKSGDDCQALIGYCYAYLIYKPRAH